MSLDLEFPIKKMENQVENDLLSIKCSCNKEVVTQGTTIEENSDGTYSMKIDKQRVTERSFKYIMDYIYQEGRVSFEKPYDYILIQEVQISALYLHLHRLEAICFNYLNPAAPISVPANDYLENMKWAYQVKDLNLFPWDLLILCKSSNGREIEFCKTHMCLLYVSEFVRKNYENFPIVSGHYIMDLRNFTKNQVESIVRFCYYKEFHCDYHDLFHCYFLAEHLGILEYCFEMHIWIAKLKDYIKEDTYFSESPNIYIKNRTDHTITVYSLNLGTIPWRTIFRHFRNDYEIETEFIKDGYYIKGNQPFKQNIFSTNQFQNIYFQFN